MPSSRRVLLVSVRNPLLTWWCSGPQQPWAVETKSVVCRPWRCKIPIQGVSRIKLEYWTQSNIIWLCHFCLFLAALSLQLSSTGHPCYHCLAVLIANHSTATLTSRTGKGLGSMSLQFYLQGSDVSACPSMPSSVYRRDNHWPIWAWCKGYPEMVSRKLCT